MAARAFLREIIDYAGLFPPASLPMAEAIKAYASYRAGSDSDLLGRFILPVARLDEFSSSLASLESEIARSGMWRMSAIPAAANDVHRTDIERFNERHANGDASVGAIIDTIEMPVESADQVRHAADVYGKSFSVFLEPTRSSDSNEVLSEICRAGVAAKLRTGGVVDSAIPSPAAVLSFIDRCADIGLRFKATAGLHHAIRGSYPLTYERDSARGTMFGFLNVFLTAAYRRAGLDQGALLELLQESDSSSIMFDDEGARWRGNRASIQDLLATRASVATSFGSCSFTEPVEEARQLHLI